MLRTKIEQLTISIAGAKKLLENVCHRFVNVRISISVVAAFFMLMPQNARPNQVSLHSPLNSPVWLPFSHSRTYLDLSGQWSFKKRSEKSWSTIRIPSFLSKEGTFLFQRHFKLDSTFANKKLQLLSLGTQQKCTVYLNNKFIGSHGGGNQSFIFDLPSNALQFKQPNEILLEVDTRLNTKTGIPLKIRPQGIPLAHSGVFGDLFLTASPNPGIKSVHANYDIDEHFASCQMILDIVFEGPMNQNSHGQEEKFGCLAEIWQPGARRPIVKSKRINLELSPSSELSVKIKLEITDIRLWSPSDPFLYKTRIYLFRNGQRIDEIELPLGFRKALVDDGRIKVNNNPVKLRIIEWVDDLLIRQLSGDSLANLIKEDMAKIKALGANCVRVVGGQPHPALLTSCDELGLFVLEELPVNGVPERILLRDDFQNTAKAVLQNQIYRDWNHPSILAWGLGRGFNPKSKNTQTFISNLAEFARGLDTKLIYAAVQGKHIFDTSLPVDLQLLEITPGQSLKSENLESNLISGTTTPALIPSFSVPIIPYKHYLEHPQKAEEKQAFEIKIELERLLKANWSSGVAINAWRDWGGDFPRLIFGPRAGAYFYISGIVNRHNIKRLSHAVVKAGFSDTPSPKITKRVAEKENPAIYTLTGIVVLLIFLFNYRRDRTFRLYLRRVFIHPHGFYVDRRENRLVSPFHSLLIGFTVAITLSLTFSSLAYSLKGNLYLDHALSVIFLNPQIAYRFLWLIWHPLWFILCSIVCISLIAIVFVLFLKVVSIFSRKRLRFYQIMMSVNWMLANLLFAFPLSIIFYRALQHTNMTLTMLSFFVLMLIWAVVRVIRGTKVLLTFSRGKTWLLFGISLAIISLIVGVYLEQTRAFSDYFLYYVSLLH